MGRRHRVAGIVESAGAPVFFDITGRRWHRTLSGLLAFMVLSLVFLTWMLPQAMAPLWQVLVHQEQEFPRQAVIGVPGRELPLVGGDQPGIFTRVARVRHEGDQVLLEDPFSGRMFRALNEEERAIVGYHPYAMERFGAPPDHQLMLTFDDGPHEAFTPQLLDLLSRNGVPATFFVIGENTVKAPALVDRMVREGHMVANHTLAHNPDFYSVSDFNNRQALIATDHIIRAASGNATRLWRIPEGNPEKKPLAVLQGQQLGYLQVDFDIDTHDWSYAAAGQPIPLPELDGQGHVVLLHDGGGDRSATLTLVQQLIDKAKAQGYSFTTMAPMLPSEYLPVQAETVTLADRVVYGVVWANVVLPGMMLFYLAWFGYLTLGVITVVYGALAWINHFRQKRKRWSPVVQRQLVSVIIPAYNEAKVIRKTLQALRASTYPSFEVIAIDDGSEDETYTILTEYASNWPQLRVIQQKNGGKAAALSNAVLHHARGDIVVTLDADTLFEPQTISKLVRHFEDPAVGVVGGHIKVGNRKNLLTWWQSLEYLVGICVTRMGEGALGAITIAPGACAGWRKQAIQRVGGFPHDTRAEDADLTMSIQQLGYKVSQDNEAVAWTEAPERLRQLLNQRLRWMFGILQALWKHRGMLFRPRYGMLGMAVMPYSVLTLVVSLVFLPLMAYMALASIVNGNWKSLGLFAGIVAGVHLAQAVMALVMVRERAWVKHLLVVPVYRFIYELLRAYLLYASLLHILRGNGRAYLWNKLERKDSVPTSTVGQVMEIP